MLLHEKLDFFWTVKKILREYFWIFCYCPEKYVESGKVLFMNIKNLVYGEYGFDCSYRDNNVHSAFYYCIKRVLSRICSKKLRASLTLEASAVVPLFLLFSIAFMSFLTLMYLQINLQINMEETARSMGKKAYILHQISSGNTQGDEFNGEEASLMTAGINPATIKIWLLSNGKIRKIAERSRITGGADGLYTFNSSYDETDGILDIVVHYDYVIPWLPQSFGKLRLAQRIKSHVWIGKSLVENGGKGSEESGETVYITPTGTVYHNSKSCSYLELSIHTANTGVISSQRNANGSRYERCSSCTSAGYSGTVYITNYGTNWHSSLSCSGLKRTVTEVNINEISGMRECSKCGEGH